MTDPADDEVMCQNSAAESNPSQDPTWEDPAAALRELAGAAPKGLRPLMLQAADEIEQLRGALRSCYYGGLTSWTEPLLKCVTDALGIESDTPYPAQGNAQCLPPGAP